MSSECPDGWRTDDPPIGETVIMQVASNMMVMGRGAVGGFVDMGGKRVPREEVMWWTEATVTGAWTGLVGLSARQGRYEKAAAAHALVLGFRGIAAGMILGGALMWVSALALFVAAGLAIGWAVYADVWSRKQ